MNKNFDEPRKKWGKITVALLKKLVTFTTDFNVNPLHNLVKKIITFNYANIAHKLYGKKRICKEISSVKISSRLLNKP